MSEHVNLILAEPFEGLDGKLFPDIPPAAIRCSDSDRITIFWPRKRTVPWKSVFDVLEERGLLLEFFSFVNTYEKKTDWKRAEMDGVVAAVLTWDDCLDLRNSVSELSVVFCEKPPAGVLPDHVPIKVSRRPKGLIAAVGEEMVFSHELCALLSEHGAAFDTQDVFCKEKSLGDCFRILPEKRVPYFSPLCLRDPESICGGLPKVLNCGIFVAPAPPTGWSLALDTHECGIAGEMENYIVNLDIAREMLARFRLAGRHIEPVFRLNGPVGEVFQAIRERVMRLMVNRQEKSAPETKPEPAKRGPFQVIHTDAICTLAGPTLEYSIVHRSAARGGKHHTEKRIDCHLFQSGKLPDAALDAPIASWLLARLCAEGGGVFDEPSERGSDGGGLVYDFLVREAKGKPVAGFQLSADTQRVQLTLNCDVAVDPQLVVQDFLALLLREPEKLAKCRVRICDPEWREMPHDYEPEPKRSTRNWYGWSGEKFYGADNVWDAQSVHHERPVAYREYLAASCEAGGE